MNRAEAGLEIRRHTFEKTGNPFQVWAALRDARAAGLPVPEWVLENLSLAATGLLELDPAGAKDPYKPIATVLGMESPGRGQSTRLSEFHRQERDADLAMCVVDHLTAVHHDQDGDYFVGIPKASEIAAAEKGTSPQAAMRAYKWLRDKLGLQFI